MLSPDLRLLSLRSPFTKYSEEIPLPHPNTPVKFPPAGGGDATRATACRAVLLLILCAASASAAQFNTPVVDGLIAPAEYVDRTNGAHQQTGGG